MIANIITGIRILCSIVLLFCTTLSPVFYTLYIVAGFTDMIDGWMARRTNTVSEFGAKWDTIADFIFVVVCMIKLVPVIVIPIWLYIWIGVIAGIKFFNMGYSYAVNKTFVAFHSSMNKATGFMLYLLPFTLNIIELKYSAAIICIVATCAAIHEGLHIIKIHYE